MGEPFVIISEGPALGDFAERIKDDLPVGEPVSNFHLWIPVYILTL